MPWWSVLRDGVRRPRADSSAAADKPSVQRHSAAESQPALGVQPAAEQAWRDLPILQRTLAEPIEPAAPLDTFTGSLTAHQNPSFLAPLGHRVDPGAGGLVDGLADLKPGHPISYRAASELPVPTAAKAAPKLALQRTLAEWPARSASWPGADSTDPYLVDTVPMELPVVDVSTEGGGVVTGQGTSNAPLALSVPTPSPVAPPPRVQRHAVAPAGVAEEPVEAGAAGMEAIEGLTVSRLAESAAPPADAPTLGRTGHEPPTGFAAMPLPGRTGAATEPVGHAHPESGAAPKEGSRTAEGSALPIAPVQRQAPQAADLSVRRTWPVLPEQAVRAPSFPALPLVELPVARSAESGAPPAAQTDSGVASDLGLASADAASGGAEPTDAPLSGFAAAIPALHAGDEADAPVQRGADPGAAGLDNPPVHRPSTAGIDGSAGMTAGMPVQRLVVGPGASIQGGSSQGGSNSTVAPTLGGTASDAPTLGMAQPAGDLPGEVAGQDRSGRADVLGTSDPPIAGSTGGHLPATPARSPEVVDDRLVGDELPELPVVAPDRPAAARGSVAMPVVGSAPVQRSAADPAGWTPVRTAGLLASRTPTLQLAQLSSATPVPPPVQRVTFLTDATSRGAVVQQLPAPAPTATTSGRSASRQQRAAGVRAAGPATQSVAALQRTVDSATSSPHSAAATADARDSALASRQDRFSAFESDALGDALRWEQVPLEQATDGESAASVVDGIKEPAVVQRAVEFAAGPATGPPGGTGEHSDTWTPADSDVVALDGYAAVRQVEPQAPPRRPATVMPPLTIVQRHAAAADPAPTPAHRSSSAGISFTSMFSAASEAAETGYTTVQLQADDSSPGLDAAEPDSATTASAAGPAVQREGEAPAPSTPTPGGAPAGGAPVGADLDEMARRLFEPLSARLRAEFWLDRERAGLMTDARP